MTVKRDTAPVASGWAVEIMCGKANAHEFGCRSFDCNFEPDNRSARECGRQWF
jgi:hypothetical protein